MPDPNTHSPKIGNTSAGAVRHLLWVAAGKFLVLGSMLACGIIVARAAQSPAEYAFFAAGLSLVLLIDATLGSPLDLATVRFSVMHLDDPVRVDQFAAAAFRIKLMGGVAVVATSFVASRPLAGLLFGDAQRVLLLRVAVISAVALLLLRGTAVHLQIRFLFHRYAAFDALQGGLRLLATLALLAVGIRLAEWYLAGYGLAAAVVFAFGVIWIPQPYLFARWPPRSDARALFGFLATTAGIVVLGTVTGHSDILFLTALGDADQAGQYAAAAHLARLATMLAIFGSIVCQPRVIPAARAGRVGELMRWNLLGAAIVGVLAVPAGFFLLDPLVPALLGREFAASVPILKLLIVGTCADIFFMPVMMTFAVQVYPRASLACEIGITLVFLAVAPVAALHGPMMMAGVATGVRILKFVCYAGIFWHHWRCTTSRSQRFPTRAR